MRACMLASGSGGNAILVEADGAALLVDCGLTVPALKRRLALAGCDPRSIRAVLLTHDHRDHTGSAPVLARKLGVPLVATAGTHSVLQGVPPELERTVRAEESFELEGFRVLPFATPHDGIESVAFRIEHAGSGRALGVATDLGYVSRQVVERLRGVNALVIEHNHDKRLLVEGPYPPALKKRILGTRGHLSNEEGATLVSHVMHDGLRQVVLAHLSETNNTPDHARAAFERVNAGAHGALQLLVASQSDPSPVFEV